MISTHPSFPPRTNWDAGPSKSMAALRLCTAACLLSAPAALSQPLSPAPFELERLVLNPNGQGSLVLGTGELLPEGSARLAVAGHYQSNPLTLYREGVRLGAVVGHRATGHLLAAWAPMRWLELGAQVPLVVWQGGDDLSSRGVVAPARSGLGTPQVHVRLGLLSQRWEAPVDLALELAAGLPLGSEAALARDRIVRITPRVMLGRSLGWLRAGVEAGALVRPAVVLGDGRTVQDEVGSELLLGAVLATQGTGVRGELNVRGSVPLGARESGALEVLAGLRLPLGSVAEAYALGGPGFGDAPGTPAFRLLLGVALGGVGTAGGRPRAAVASSDDDRDGVPNTEDSCPAEAGPASRRGCPVKDTDKDGIADDHDSCPTRAGPPSTLGCPVPTKDTDKDGISDERDDCPNEAGPASSLGCPVKLEGASRAGDSDKDGVADTLDNCPTEAGAASNQGCPAQQPQLVTLRDGKLELQEQVAFAPGKAVVIQKGSHTLLEQVARVLVQHPELGRVVIEGHTDNRGKAEANRKLSLARAEAVKAFLVGKGVQGARLEARGMGSEQPIRSNLTESGRVANRRMEFIIAPPERELK